MNLGAILKQAKRVTSDNAPTILTAVGVTGLVTTAVLTGQASFKAAEILAVRHHELVDGEFEPLPFVEKAKIIGPDLWKFYVPAVGTGALAIACMISANRIQTRRAAALASAYSLSQQFFKEYKDKVLEKLGDKKEQEICDEVAQDRVSHHPVPGEVVIVTGQVLCFDARTGRYFNSDLESLRKAENDINYEINNSYYASLGDFYDLIGLPPTDESNEVGWNSDTKFTIDYSTTMSPDGRPCISISFITKPIRGYSRVY